VVPSIIAVLADGAADAIGLAAIVGAVVAAGVVVAPALEQAPTKATAMRRPAKAPVRVRLFTWFSCVVDRDLAPDPLVG
jgi:hypothetical protein